MATPVTAQDSTVAAMRRKVRRLTASASEASLSTADIDQQLNTAYSQDFPYGIKMDQMRSVYTFYTAPYIDKYPLNVNYNQGVRSPMYVDGIQGQFFKDREQFFNLFPKWPTLFQPINGDGVTQVFNFTIGATPIIRGEVTLGGTDVSGIAIRVSDDGNGNLLLNTPNPVVSVPTALTNVPGMKNLNTANPGDLVQVIVGSVNYITATFAINFALGGVTPIAGETMRLNVSQYQPSKPYTMLFWNNEFTIRPIPKYVHKVTIETYLTPVQFMESTDNPILLQWWQWLAICAAKKILQERQDMEGVANMQILLDEQTGLVLERQAIEEIGMRNSTIYSGTTQGQGWNQGQWGGW